MSRPTERKKAVSPRKSPADRITLAVQYHRRAESAAHQMALWGALCGMELLALKRETAHGDWADFYALNVADRLNIRTAQNYMRVADGVRAKALKNESAFVFDLLKIAPSDLTDDQRAEQAAMVRGITDGETMASLIEAYRITKRPPAAPAGGYHPDRTLLPAWAGEQGLPPEIDYAALPPEQQATYRQWESHRQAERILSPEQTAFDFYAPLLRELSGDHHGPRRWMHLPDPQRAELRDTLRAILAVLDATFPAQS